MRDRIKLSGRELDVMKILWKANKPMIAKDIVDYNPMLSINTVQAVLKGLLKKKYIKVTEIVYSGTVLTRSYVPELTLDDYMIDLMEEGGSIEGIMIALLKKEENEKEVIQKLENILREYKKKLKMED